MRVECKIFWLPKSGNTSDEYEDAACPAVSHDAIELPQYRCAIADGATETSFAKDWATLLANGYVDEQPVSELREQWQSEIPTENQPWYVEEKAYSGAFAAFLGFTLDSDGTFSAEAIGDCCLLHVRGRALICSFPLKSSEQFDNQPLLLSSKEDSDDEQIQSSRGSWESADTFILVSDAIACWSLRDPEHLEKLLQLDSQEKFSELVERERSLANASIRAMRNDDVTLMRVRVHD